MREEGEIEKDGHNGIKKFLLLLCDSIFFWREKRIFPLLFSFLVRELLCVWRMRHDSRLIVNRGEREGEKERDRPGKGR